MLKLSREILYYFTRQGTNPWGTLTLPKMDIQMLEKGRPQKHYPETQEKTKQTNKTQHRLVQS